MGFGKRFVFYSNQKQSGIFLRTKKSLPARAPVGITFYAISSILNMSLTIIIRGLAKLVEKLVKRENLEIKQL